MCMSVCLARMPQVSNEARRGRQIPTAGVTDGCGTNTVSAESQTRVLWESSKHPSPTPDIEGFCVIARA